jgi:hypothetical protein
MRVGIFWQLVGWFSLPLLAILAAVLIWRKILNEFPLFSCYILASATAGVGRLVVYYGSRKSYPYAYWTSGVLLTLLALLAAYELFWRRLFPRFHKVRFYRYLFPVVAVLLSLLAVPALEAHRFVMLLVVTHVLDALRVATLLFFVGLMLFMGRDWTKYELGIGLGLGLQASALLATFAIWTTNPAIRGFLNQLPAIAYDLACLIWLVTFASPEKRAAIAKAPLGSEIVREAQQWEKSLKRSLTGKKHSR